MLAVAAGCGGGSSSSDNGIADKSAHDIVQASLAAARNAQSVHMVASLTSNGQPLHFDIKIVKGKGGAGSLSESGVSFKLIRLGDKAYFNGGTAFWTQAANATAAQLFAGKWIVASATTGNFASFTKLTDLNELLGQALANPGTLTKGKTSTIDGTPVIEVKSSKGGSLFVATTGTPFPVKILGTSSSPGSLDFKEWNQPVTLTAPKNAIDYDKLTSGG